MILKKEEEKIHADILAGRCWDSLNKEERDIVCETVMKEVYTMLPYFTVTSLVDGAHAAMGTVWLAVMMKIATDPQHAKAREILAKRMK